MSHKVAQFTRQIRSELPQAEADLDIALLSISTLLSTLVSARIETGAHASTGQRAVAELVRAQQAMVEASGAIAKAHIVMRNVGREQGAHDIEDCPPSTGSMNGSLTIAA
jgi:hypothetical protein